MSRLLTDSDYLSVSYSDAVTKLISDFYPQWLTAEQVGQEEIKTNLNQRYDVDKIFTNTTVWKNTLVYKAKNLVQYTEAVWNENTSYVALTSDRVSYEGKIYQCATNSQGRLPTNTGYWTYICDDLSLFFGNLPNNEWSNKTEYAIGDIIWYNDYTYTCAVANKNILPDSSTHIWGTGTPYTISSATLPTDTSKWTKGDNRNPQIVRYLLDCAFYHFMRAVPARDFPDRIKEAYDGNTPNQTGGVIGWLKRVSEGDISLNVPERIDTEVGKPIISGNSVSTNIGNTFSARDNFTWF